tara:strand:- start:2883 stop:3065 length:183 start_codon:yes stop_codon:yes gene_type:complete
MNKMFGSAAELFALNNTMLRKDTRMKVFIVSSKARSLIITLFQHRPNVEFVATGLFVNKN